MQEIKVEDARLSSGYGSGEREGDIYASLCLDKIPEQKVTRPFRCKGMLLVATNITFAAPRTAAAYQLLPEEEFEGQSVTYREKVMVDGGEAARNDPNGFYHGMKVSHASKAYVMTGPPITLIGRKSARQGNLFV